jgi:hypothetical protein
MGRLLPHLLQNLYGDATSPLVTLFIPPVTARLPHHDQPPMQLDEFGSPCACRLGPSKACSRKDFLFDGLLVPLHAVWSL